MVKMTTKAEIARWLSKKKEWTGYHSFSDAHDKYPLLLVAALIDGKIQIFKPDVKFKRNPEKYKFYDFSYEVVKWIKYEQTKKDAIDKIYAQIKEYFVIK